MRNFLKMFILLNVVSQGVFAQRGKIAVRDGSYKIGEPYQVVDAPIKYYFYQDDELMTVKIRGKKVTIQKMSTKSLAFKSVNEYKEMPAGFELETIKELNGKYFMLYSIWDRANTSEQLFSREIDFNSGSLNDDEKLLLKTDTKITRDYGSYDKFNLENSFDESKLLIWYRKKPEEKRDDKNFDQIGLFVFDNNLEELWGDEVRMPYSEKKMNNLDYSIDKEGNAYILAQVFSENSKENRNASRIEILRVPAGSKNIKKGDIESSPVELKDKTIRTIGFYEGPGDYMICAGYYGKGKNNYGFNGIFQFKVEKEGDIYDEKSYEFPLKLLNQYESERTQRRNERDKEKGKDGLSDLVLRNFIVNADGSILLIGEEYYWYTVRTGSGSSSSTTTYYVYNDIYITKIGVDSEIEWMKKLPKAQKGTVGQGGMSFKYMYDEESKNHYLAYLDHPKNLEILETKEEAKIYPDGGAGLLTVYQLADADGKTSKINILNTKDANGVKVAQFSVNRILKSGPGEFVFEAYKKKKEDILVKVNLNKSKSSSSEED